MSNVAWTYKQMDLQTDWPKEYNSFLGLFVRVLCPSNSYGHINILSQLLTWDYPAMATL